VRRRHPTHDHGVDLDIARPDLRAIVQCKRWRHPVGPAVVRDLYGTLLNNGTDLGILARSKWWRTATWASLSALYKTTVNITLILLFPLLILAARERFRHKEAAGRAELEQLVVHLLCAGP
jgi:hypothetical protein